MREQLVITVWLFSGFWILHTAVSESVPGYDTLSDTNCGGVLLETHSDIASGAICREKCDDNPVCLVSVLVDTTCQLKDMCTSVSTVSGTVSYLKNIVHVTADCALRKIRSVYEGKYTNCANSQGKSPFTSLGDCGQLGACGDGFNAINYVLASNLCTLRTCNSPITASTLAITNGYPRDVWIRACADLVIENGHADVVRGEVEFDSATVTLSCDVGYYLNVSGTPVSCSSAKWHGQMPICERIPEVHVEFGQVDNGNYLNDHINETCSRVVSGRYNTVSLCSPMPTQLILRINNFGVYTKLLVIYSGSSCSGGDIMAYAGVDNSQLSCGSPGLAEASSGLIDLCRLQSEAGEEGQMTCVYECPPVDADVYVVLSSSRASVGVCEARFIP